MQRYVGKANKNCKTTTLFGFLSLCRLMVKSYSLFLLKEENFIKLKTLDLFYLDSI